tara:strand:- start:356 stop:544 length:189 start_codon:yes stop_codon:yes gene_type:complete
MNEIGYQMVITGLILLLFISLLTTKDLVNDMFKRIDSEREERDTATNTQELAKAFKLLEGLK